MSAFINSYLYSRGILLTKYNNTAIPTKLHKNSIFATKRNVFFGLLPKRRQTKRSQCICCCFWRERSWLCNGALSSRKRWNEEFNTERVRDDLRVQVGFCISILLNKYKYFCKFFKIGCLFASVKCHITLNSNEERKNYGP